MTCFHRSVAAREAGAINSGSNSEIVSLLGHLYISRLCARPRVTQVPAAVVQFQTPYLLFDEGEDMNK